MAPLTHKQKTKAKRNAVAIDLESQPANPTQVPGGMPMRSTTLVIRPIPEGAGTSRPPVLVVNIEVLMQMMTPIA